MIATKASGLRPALQRIHERPGLVVPLLNGLDHITALRQHFGTGAVAAGTIRIEADRPTAAVITQTSPFLRVDLAADDASLHPRLHALAAALETAEVPARVGDSEAQILWGKLVRLNALACTTSASDRPIGFIRTDPEWRATLIACLDEGTAVANADGATIDAGDPLQELEDAHAELGSSMQRDIAAGREPELDAIAGAVIRAGTRHGIPTPTISRLASEIATRAGVAPPKAG
jgi:2-dehydropantoate 2-reductase